MIQSLCRYETEVVLLWLIVSLIESRLRQPVYVFEDFGSMSFMSMPAQTLQQAIANTQVKYQFKFTIIKGLI